MVKVVSNRTIVKRIELGRKFRATAQATSLGQLSDVTIDSAVSNNHVLYYNGFTWQTQLINNYFDSDLTVLQNNIDSVNDALITERASADSNFTDFQSQIDSNAARVNSVTADLDSFETLTTSNLDSANTKLESLRSDVDSADDSANTKLESVRSSLQNNIDSNYTSVLSNTASIDSVNSALIAERAATDSALDSANTKLEELRSDVDSADDSANTKLESLRTTTNLAIDSVNNSLITERASTDSNFLVTQANIDSVNSALITERSSTDSALDSANTKLESVRTSLQVNIDSVNTAVQGNDSDIIALQANIDSVNSALIAEQGFTDSSLDSANTKLESVRTSLQANIDSVNVAVQNNDSDIVVLQTNIDSVNSALITERASTDSNFANLQSQITANDSDILDLQNADDSANTKLESLRSDVDSADDSANTKLEALRTSLQGNIDSNLILIQGNDSDILALQNYDSVLTSTVSGLQTQILNNDSDILALEIQQTIAIKDSNGSIIDSNLNTLLFTGSGVSLSESGGEVIATITGGGGSGDGTASTFTQESAPDSTLADSGDLWYNTSNGLLYVYYIDDSGDKNWVGIAAASAPETLVLQDSTGTISTAVTNIKLLGTGVSVSDSGGEPVVTITGGTGGGTGSPATIDSARYTFDSEYTPADVASGTADIDIVFPQGYDEIYIVGTFEPANGDTFIDAFMRESSSYVSTTGSYAHASTGVANSTTVTNTNNSRNLISLLPSNANVGNEITIEVFVRNYQDNTRRTAIEYTGSYFSGAGDFTSYRGAAHRLADTIQDGFRIRSFKGYPNAKF